MKALKLFAGILLAFLACYVSSAQNILDFEMTVRLQKNGDALVEQVWKCDVYKGTEWYVPIGSTKGFGMSLRDLKVTENGRAFVSEGRRWDVNRNREQKAGRCGLEETASRDGHRFSFRVLESLYSKLSHRASQLASITFSSAPTVPQTSSSSLLSMTTRTRAAVAASELRTRTL